jgi:prophage antirepressor-like protein/phage antirepressor YoqD-like protein
MTTDLTPFNLGEFGQLRYCLDSAREPWFCCKDIAQSLDYASMNMPILFSHVPEEWKGSNPITTLGGPQQMLTVNEPGLNFFLGRSDKPKALPYQMKVAGEIMPSIRKFGAYIAPEKLAEVSGDPKASALLFADLNAERARTAKLAARNAELDAKAAMLDLMVGKQDLVIGKQDLVIERQAERIEADRPDVVFSKTIRECEGLVEVGEVAEMAGFGRNTAFGVLRRHGVLCRVPGSRWNMPTAKARGLIVEIEKPQFDGDGRPVYGPGGRQRIHKVSMATPEGQKYIINLLKEWKAGEDAKAKAGKPRSLLDALTGPKETS